jgi:hypothetical protein
MPRYKYSDEDITKLVAECDTVSDVLRKLGMRMAGGSHAHISRRIKNLGLDTSHFLNGKNYSTGKKFPNKQKNLSEILIFDENISTRVATKFLKRGLLESGIEYKCSECDISDWCGHPITLHVDHIDGNWKNNEIKNLRFLCPNCHSQTGTFGSKNKTKD